MAALDIEVAPGLATDQSHASLELAPRNAERHGVSERIEFRQGDLFGAVSAQEKFDLIVSNPPYVKTSEVDLMEPEVKSWEPASALVSGTDGMNTTRRMIDGALIAWTPTHNTQYDTRNTMQEEFLAKSPVAH